MTLEYLLEIAAPGVLSAAAAWGAMKAELRALHRRIKALEQHQQLQSSRIWSVATKGGGG
jgi:hypothetical protein